MQREWPLTEEEFGTIYAKVPRLTVEVLLAGDQGVYLTERAIEPCKGAWHLPGGTVFFGESLLETVERIAKRELGIEVKAAKQVGYIEYPSHYKKLADHENAFDHPVGIVFEVTDYSGTVGLNNEATSAGWFTKLPDKTHADQDDFLRSHGYAE